MIAGFGFRRMATLDSLRDALQRAGAQTVTHLATVEDKAQTDVFQALGRETGLPVIGIDSAVLTEQETATRSAASLAERGSGSVAEAAALAAAGTDARLVVARVISGDRMATCALAEKGSP